MFSNSLKGYFASWELIIQSIENLLSLQQQQQQMKWDDIKALSLEVQMMSKDILKVESMCVA